jgi:hypothetical protein
MTAEDARRSVEALSQLLRDEVSEAMGDRALDDRGPGAPSAGAPGARPAWLTAGEEHLARALRASRPGDFGGKAAQLFDGSRLGGGLSGASRFRSWTTVRGWALAALVAGGLAVGAGIASWQSERSSDAPALAFRTAGDPTTALRHSGRVIAPADRAEELRFSDGSRLSLAAGSMLRVRETDAHGAMVIVEEGQVESHIQHTGKARWSVFAGAYEVRVVGTRFSTTWDPARQRLAVVLHQGSVQVLGKGIDELVELKPGQRFDSGGLDGKWFVTATLGTDDAARSASSDAAAASADDRLSRDQLSRDQDDIDQDDRAARAEAEGPSARASAPGQRGGGAERAEQPSVSWGTLVAHGRFEEVLEEAGSLGEATCLRTCSVADVRALADAARYTGRFALAERALTELRKAASEAPRAGFLLGSLNEAQGRPALALEWYGRYLAEAPGGSLVAEARAGRMRALLALGQTEAAKAAARDYLRLHPAGVGAAAARQLLLRP